MLIETMLQSNPIHTVFFIMNTLKWCNFDFDQPVQLPMLHWEIALPPKTLVSYGLTIEKDRQTLDE